MESKKIEKNGFSKWVKNKLISVWNHLISIYISEYGIYKAIAFVIIGAFVLGTSFGIREIILNIDTQQKTLINGFLDIYVTGNNGVAFGSMGNANPSIVYLVQSLPIVICFIILIFTKNIYIDMGLSAVMFGGLSNVIDRSIVDHYVNINIPQKETIDAVVDYLRFSFIPGSAIFNLPDVFVIVGIIGVCLSYVIYIIIESLKTSKNKENEFIKEN